jgi:small-conductance mechanosensitive channel
MSIEEIAFWAGLIGSGLGIASFFGVKSSGLQKYLLPTTGVLLIIFCLFIWLVLPDPEGYQPEWLSLIWIWVKGLLIWFLYKWLRTKSDKFIDSTESLTVTKFKLVDNTIVVFLGIACIIVPRAALLLLGLIFVAYPYYDYFH